MLYSAKYDCVNVNIPIYYAHIIHKYSVKGKKDTYVD